MRNVVDHYTRKAHAEHYRARSVYKLIEIDEKFGVVKKCMQVLDLGCSPGSWSQYMLKKIGRGRVVGVDTAGHVQVHDNRFRFISADIHTLTVENLNGQKFDLITSDAMPHTTGNKFVDSQASLNLVRSVFRLAQDALVPGGIVVAKVFQGEDLGKFILEIKKRFERVVLFKPKSSRKESREIFIIAFDRKR